MIAYASAYLKCHYLAAFTAAMLNNQPMGFYHPSILIKDAQRHGLRVLPVDVTKSDWPCTVYWSPPRLFVQPHPAPGLSLCPRPCANRRSRSHCARAGRAPFTSVDDLALRVPELRKDEMKMLAEVGALNPLQEIHRRDALWMAERAVRPVGPLLEQLEAVEGASPLARMTVEERLTSDFRGTGVTIGKHPMAYRRDGDAGAGSDSGGVSGARPEWPVSADCGIGDRAAAARHGERVRVPEHGRRNRSDERYHRAGHLRPL
jgi:error-prone DNA polymerase